MRRWRIGLRALLLSVVMIGLVAIPSYASSAHVQAAAPGSLTSEQLHTFEQYVDDLFGASGLPGASVGVVQNGEVVYLKGFGVRDLGGDAPVTPDTLMMIGSVNKSLTSFLAATLVDAGQVTWDTPVVSLLPSFAVSDPALTKTLTLSDAFCACTRLARHDIEIEFNASDLSPEALIASVKDFPLTAPLGESFQYSNQMFAIGGYAAASTIDAAPSDLSAAYREGMQRRVLDPIGMDHSTFNLSDVLASGDYAGSHGLTLSGEFVTVPLDEESFFMNTVAPAGAMWSSARDMTRYVQTLLSGGIAPDGE